MHIAVVIPTYNESENIVPLVEGIRALPLPTRVIVVDDNSPDGTGKLVDEMSARDSAVRALHRPAKLGLGTAHIAGIKQALAGGAEMVVTMDADFSHHPRYIPDLVAAMNHYDLCIGSRYVSGGGTLHCTLPRRLLSYGANAFARLMLGLHAHDCTAGFRCYRRGVLEKVPLDSIFSDGYSFLIEMLYLCQKSGARVGEVPITFENRRRGKSKISRKEIAAAMYTVLRLAARRVGSG
ncbi:MAG: polyprenol monophosphomannose synthase [Anaerolineae bacterium]|jgi:glycosyltransferase involved in cell wall biosynthesis